jgi:hypothetical protein
MGASRTPGGNEPPRAGTKGTTSAGGGDVEEELSGAPSGPEVRSWFDCAFDFEYRPESYWAETPSEATVVNRINGAVRRRAVANALADGDGPPPEIVDIVLNSILNDSTRLLFSAIDPAMMGGEYLPELDDDDVEIARFELCSTTFDVISLRASRRGNEIIYKLVDEYEGFLDGWELPRTGSRRPLLFGELIDLIDGSTGAIDTGGSVFDGILDGAGPEYEGGFITVSSSFYPQLGLYYEKRGLQRLVTNPDFDEYDAAEDDGDRARFEQRLAVTYDPWPVSSSLPAISQDTPSGETIDAIYPTSGDGLASWRHTPRDIWLPPLPLKLKAGAVPRSRRELLRVKWVNASGYREDAPTLLVFEAAATTCGWVLLTARDEHRRTLLLAAAEPGHVDPYQTLLESLLACNGEDFGIQLFTRAPARIQSKLAPEHAAQLIASGVAPPARFWATLEAQLGIKEADWNGWPADPTPSPGSEPEWRIAPDELDEKRSELEAADPWVPGMWANLAWKIRLREALDTWRTQ